MSKQDFRISKTSISGVAQREKPWKSIEKAQDAFLVCPSRNLGRFLKALTPGQRALIAIEVLRSEVCNGGFGQYFWNSSCRLAPEALEGLSLIGATKHAELLSEAIAAGKITRADFLNETARRRKLKRVQFKTLFEPFDTRFYALEKSTKRNLDALAKAFYEAHQANFNSSEEEFSSTLKAEVTARRVKDYRIKKPKAKLNPEEFTWKLIEKLWDDYWEELKAGKESFHGFLSLLPGGQRAIIAIDILNKNILQLEGVLGFVSNTTGSEILCEEVRNGYSLLSAKPYLDLWSKWLAQARDLIELATISQKLGNQYRAVRDTKGPEAASEIGKQYITRSRELRDCKQSFEVKAGKIDQAFKSLLADEKTAIERFISEYVANHPDEFLRASS